MIQHTLFCLISLIFHREPLIIETVVGAWLKCASSESCICPVDSKEVQKCWKRAKHNTVGWCHRFDQSAISIILAKLFRENYNHFAIPMKNWTSVNRKLYEGFYYDQKKAREKRLNATLWPMITNVEKKAQRWVAMNPSCHTIQRCRPRDTRKHIIISLI